MSRTIFSVIFAFGLLLLTAGVVQANADGGLIWSFQNTGFSAGSNITGVAMRNGEAWPVVFAGSGNAYSLFPTNSGGTSNWRQIGSSLFTSGERLRTASSVDGRVAVVSQSTSSASGVVSSLPAGFSPLSTGIRAAAFSPSGTLYTATATSVNGVGGYTGTTIEDLAITSDGTVGVVDQGGKYWGYNAWTGWQYQMLTGSGWKPDLAFDSVGRPHVLGYESGMVKAYDFDTISGTWINTNLGNMSSGVPVIASNQAGTVGAAWVDSSGTLYYAYKNDTSAWSVTQVTTGLSMPSQSVGLAYDYAGLPVISYIGGSTVWIAYDPVIPEPASLSLLSLLGIGCLLRRRRF